MANIEKQTVTVAPPLEVVNGTAAESYDELLIEEIIVSAAHARLTMIGGRLRTVSVSLMNRNTVNNIRLEGMRNQYIARLIADTPEFGHDSPAGRNKQAEHAELNNKSRVAETIVRRAAPETIPRQYSYDELMANRVAISQRIAVVAMRVGQIYIEHSIATLELIKVREKIRDAETDDDLLTIIPGTATQSTTTVLM